MVMTAVSPESPKVAVSKVGGNVKIDDISISEEQARELWKSLDHMFSEYYQQEG